mgnify:CR=1 FL=1
MKKTKSLSHGLQKMLSDYQKYMKKYTSKFWIHENKLHINNLLGNGYDKFKQTIASSYFTFLNEPSTSAEVISQWSFLLGNLSEQEIISAIKFAKNIPPLPYTRNEFNLTTLLLWQYAKNQGLEKELAKLSEPAEGCPPGVRFEDRLISQDLANSLLEFNTINQHIPTNSIRTILEIGAGYGRSAYIWFLLGNIKKYIIVDIPPALFISQRYLSSQFPTRKVLRYRDINSFKDIRDEYDKADIIFLMPWQIEMLPGKSIDLIFSIDSLNEMKFDIVRFYFKVIDKLGKKYFYMKCRQEWNENDEGIVKWGNYPIPMKWKKLLDRECRVQTMYFESLYKLP